MNTFYLAFIITNEKQTELQSPLTRTAYAIQPLPQGARKNMAYVHFAIVVRNYKRSQSNIKVLMKQL